MKKLIHYDPTEAGQLHCDACGYDMPHKAAITPSMIGTPCPKCNADMLTRADYEKTVKLFAVIDWLNKWFGWLGSKELRPADEVRTISVKIHNNEMVIRREKAEG